MGLALLLLVSPDIYSVDIYPGPEPMYQLTESELIELENTLMRQALTIERLQMVLTEQQETMSELATLRNRQQMTIKALSESFDEYERAVRRGRIQTILRSGATGVAIGVVVAVLAGVVF